MNSRFQLKMIQMVKYWLVPNHNLSRIVYSTVHFHISFHFLFSLIVKETIVVASTQD